VRGTLFLSVRLAQPDACAGILFERTAISYTCQRKPENDPNAVKSILAVVASFHRKEAWIPSQSISVIFRSSNLERTQHRDSVWWWSAFVCIVVPSAFPDRSTNPRKLILFWKAASSEAPTNHCRPRAQEVLPILEGPLPCRLNSCTSLAHDDAAVSGLALL
jgi:hypothetical protein